MTLCCMMIDELTMAFNFVFIPTVRGIMRVHVDCRQQTSNHEGYLFPYLAEVGTNVSVHGTILAFLALKAGIYTHNSASPQ